MDDPWAWLTNRTGIVAWIALIGGGWLIGGTIGAIFGIVVLGGYLLSRRR